MKQIGFLKFVPIFQYRLWGGEKLKTVLHKSYQCENIGESWEISGVPNNETKVAEGNYRDWSLPQLISEFKEELVGKRVFKQFGSNFPMLIKFIDAAAPLSLQVHPNDDLAKKRHHSLGKNEMWYIMDADQEASLLIGFKETLDKDSFVKHLNNGSLLSKINNIKVHRGQTYFLPAGRVHAIGKGVLLAEIQQTSDVTYRVYDYDRVDPQTGQQRDLHIEEAMEAIDFSLHENYETFYEKHLNHPNKLIETPYFKTRYLNLDSPLNIAYNPLESFRIFIVIEGIAMLRTKDQHSHLKKGESILIPANETNIDITPKDGTATLLEVYF